MASTFSPSLRIELIGAGEQAGTWGTTTNTNLGTLVEDAISGYVSVTISSANQALTANNGAADQARNAILELVSAPSAFAVYAPPESKQYTIFNNTSHTATIYNSTTLGNTTAAGTGVAIPAGKTVSVWSDDTDFRVQNNILVGDVVGNVTGNVTGQLNGTIASATTAVTQAPGTSNTTVATTAFANAAFQGAYPVGSIYMNASVATNPGTLFGFGTWVAFGAGRVPVGFNAADPLFDTAEETGGSKDAVVVSHTHTATSTVTDPGHAHGLSVYGLDSTNLVARVPANGDDTGLVATATTNNATTGITVATTNASAGSSGTNANLQPYITVYMWKRTA
jgi:hypothetical protein